MLRAIGRFIALWFISKSMDHKYAEDRNLIFRTIVKTLEKVFKGDTLKFRYHSIVVWMLRNDTEFIKCCFKDGLEFKNELEVWMSTAVQRAFSETLAQGKNLKRGL